MYCLISQKQDESRSKLISLCSLGLFIKAMNIRHMFLWRSLRHHVLHTACWITWAAACVRVACALISADTLVLAFYQVTFPLFSQFSISQHFTSFPSIKTQHVALHDPNCAERQIWHFPEFIWMGLMRESKCLSQLLWTFSHQPQSIKGPNAGVDVP